MNSAKRSLPHLLAALASCLALSQSAALAQTGIVKLSCTGWSQASQFKPTANYTMLATIDYDARKMTVEEMDPGGNISRGTFGSPPGAPTQFFEDRIVTRMSSNDRSYQEYTFNRYSAVLSFTINWVQNELVVYIYSTPCQPFQRGQRQY